MSSEGRYSFLDNFEILQRYQNAVSEGHNAHMGRTKSTNLMPENTKRNNAWAVNSWNSWAMERNKTRKTGELYVPQAEQLMYLSADELNIHLCKFVFEVRRYDGSVYPPNSLYQLSCGLLRYLRHDCRRTDLHILDHKNTIFHPFQDCLMSEMKRLSEQGVGSCKKNIDVISEKHERTLWERQLLGVKDSRTMIRTVFFYNCKLLDIHGRDRHRQLQVGQFSFGQDSQHEFIIFSPQPDQNKTLWSGRTSPSQRKYILDEPWNQYNPYTVYKLYLRLVPGQGPFYRKAVPAAVSDGSGPMFSDVPIGVNSLRCIVPSMMKEAGFTGVYTGYSIKVGLGVSKLHYQGRTRGIHWLWYQGRTRGIHWLPWLQYQGFCDNL